MQITHHNQTPGCEADQDRPDAQTERPGWSPPRDRAGLQGVGYVGCTGAGIMGKERVTSENENVRLGELGHGKKTIFLDGTIEGGGEIYFI